MELVELEKKLDDLSTRMINISYHQKIESGDIQNKKDDTISLSLKHIIEINKKEEDILIKKLDGEIDELMKKYGEVEDDNKDYYIQRKIELDKLKEYLIDSYRKYPKLFLLRGNPGLGKTSFIIYLLYMLKDYSKKYKIYVLKNINKDYCATFLYENGKLREVNKLDENVDIVISDSYDFQNIDGVNLFVLYVSSPDENSYKTFINYNLSRQCLYLDVFSDEEIKEWKEYCLPPNLSKYITDNELDNDMVIFLDIFIMLHCVVNIIIKIIGIMLILRV